MILFPCLALAPDLDVIGPALGLPDGGLVGHRGVSHSLLAAFAIAAVAGIAARRFALRPLSTALFVLLAVASHGLLDAATDGGQPVPLFWPLTTRLYDIPLQPIPVPPRGIDFLSIRGVEVAIVELVYFLPLVLYAFWPARLRPTAGSLALAVRRIGLLTACAAACLVAAELVLRDTSFISRLETPARLQASADYRAGSGLANRIHLNR